MLHPNLRLSLSNGLLNIGYALVVLLTAGCTQDFGAFRGNGGGGGQGGGGQGGQGGSPPVCVDDCNDNNPCTQDICDQDGECLHPAEDDPPLTQVLGDCKVLSCDGTEPLTEADETDIPSDDGNPCTSAACNGDMPTHPFVPEGTACNNDGVCNDAGQCSDCDDPGDCGTDTVCATYACTNNACVTTYLAPLVISGDNDGDCMALQCADGEPQPQDLPFVNDEEVDTNPCTTDTCSPAGEPVHDPAGAGTPCNDNLFCNGTDSCDAGTTCTQHTGDPCAAGGECADTCNETADNCFDLTGTACGSATNNACTNPDTCNGAGVCNPNDEGAGTPCPDALFCNGVELCAANGVCGASPGDPCLPLNTTDNDCSGSCNEGMDNCTANDPASTGCNDGLFCTLTDACNAGGSCVGTGDPCLPLNTANADCSESCNEAMNNCTANDPATTGCNDGNFCTMTDACNAGGSCVGTGNPCPGHNTGPSCDDSCNQAMSNCMAGDANGTACDEDADLTNGTCNGTTAAGNCVGD